MIRKLDESAGNVLGYEVRKEVTEEEFVSFSREFEAAIAQHGKIRLLIYMPELPKTEPGALVEDLKLTRYLNNIERYALVSDSALMEWVSKLGNALPGVEIKQFDTSRYEEAWYWVRA